MKPLKKILNRVLNTYRERYDPEKIRVLAAAYWETVLALSFFGLIGVFFYGSYIFFGVLQNLNAPYSGASITPDAALDRAKLDEILNVYLTRERNFDTARLNPTPIADPSK